jgi:type IV secretory pathway VirB2 component (pilin)
MSAAAQASLFDAPVQPVAGNAGDWLGAMLGGGLATALCIIAIAMLGIMMLSGRLPVRNGLTVVAGCFLLLSASLVARGLQGIARNTGGGLVEGERGPIIVEVEPEEPLVPADFNPYARASVRRN